MIRTVLTRPLLVSLLLAASGLCFSATFPPSTGSPLSEREARQIPGVREGNRIYSGDVIYQVSDLQIFGFRRNLWPNGLLIYAFDPAVDPARQQAFIQACQAWTASTPLRCQPRMAEPDYVLVRSHNGEACGGQANVSCSFVGKIGGAQDLFVYSTHWNIQSVIQHEIGHAIGMIHEQSRPDRDDFVFVKYGNMVSGASRQFDIAQDVNTYTEYDLESIMHYSNCSFSRHASCSLQRPDLQTVEPKACNRDRVGGTVITQLDLDGLRAAYAGSIHSLFNARRSATCGTHTLNAEQVRSMCGSNCTAATPVIFAKIEQRSGSDWGAFHVDPDYRGICRSTNKDYVRHWTDTDALSCWRGGLLTTRFEWWVECGCSQQSLPATCADYSAGLDRTKVRALLQNGSPQEKAIARYLEQVLEWNSSGAVDKEVADTFARVVMQDVLATDFQDRIFDLLCKMRIAIEAKRAVNPSYALPLKLFAALAGAARITIAK